MEVKAKKVDVRDTILSILNKDDRSLNWLANKTNINYNTMFSIFKQRTINLSDDKLDSINKVLKTKLKK